MLDNKYSGRLIGWGQSKILGGLFFTAIFLIMLFLGFFDLRINKIGAKKMMRSKYDAIASKSKLNIFRDNNEKP